MKIAHIQRAAYFPSNLQYFKAEPSKFVCNFSFLSDKNIQTVGQLSSNSPEDFAKTDDI